MAYADLITNATNIRYLCGFTGSHGFMLLTGKKQYLFTDFRYLERAKDGVPKSIEVIDTKEWQNCLKSHKINEIGVEESHLTIERYKRFKKLSRIKGQKITFLNCFGKIEDLREVKLNKEIEQLTKSQRINEKVFLEIKKIIQQALRPITEEEIAWKIRELGHQHGVQELAFDPIVAFGSHSARPHHDPTTKKLKKGEVVLIDMGMKYQGYCSDMTRMIFTAKPTPLQQEIYELVLKAQNHALKHLKAGLTGQEADDLSRDIIKHAGYSENYGHAGGHGLSLDIHEQPSLSESYTKPLKANSVITVEPGIYLPGKFGIRIEDMTLLTKNGNKNLTRAPKDIEK